MGEGQKDTQLTDKQEMFCQQYLIDFNGTQAAIRAGYSKESAQQIASENLLKPLVQSKIAELKLDVMGAVGITQAKVYQELARLAFFDIRKVYTDSGSLMPVKDIDDDSAAAIAGIKVFDEFGIDEEGNRIKTGETVEVKLINKVSALENIIKIAGWAAATKTELTGANGLPLAVRQEHVVRFENMGDE